MSLFKNKSKCLSAEVSAPIASYEYTVLNDRMTELEQRFNSLLEHLNLYTQRIHKTHQIVALGGGLLGGNSITASTATTGKR